MYKTTTIPNGRTWGIASKDWPKAKLKPIRTSNPIVSCLKSGICDHVGSDGLGKPCPSSSSACSTCNLAPLFVCSYPQCMSHDLHCNLGVSVSFYRDFSGFPWLESDSSTCCLASAALKTSMTTSLLHFFVTAKISIMWFILPNSAAKSWCSLASIYNSCNGLCTKSWLLKLGKHFIGSCFWTKNLPQWHCNSPLSFHWICISTSWLVGGVLRLQGTFPIVLIQSVRFLFNVSFL